MASRSGKNGVNIGTEKAVKIAEELGLKENVDFFLIKDACLTDLEPEEFAKEGHIFVQIFCFQEYN